MKSSYIIEYINENEFRKKERAIKKYNMLAYKKLIFEYYQNLKDGEFVGVVSKKNANEKITSYDLKLPTGTVISL